MKKKLFSRMVAIATVAVLTLGGNSLTAFAADDGNAATAPKGGTGTKVSSGAATASWDKTDENATGFNVVGDDDNTAADGADTATDISIWAKVVEHGDIVYKVDIEWGAMKFEFNNQAGKWNTETHEYDATDAGVSAEWTEDDFIDATNNKITVVNHSNWAVDATFTYAHEAQNVFNPGADDTDSMVRGHFFLDNEDAVAASKELENSRTAADELSDELMLGHQDASNATNYGGADGGEELDGTPVPGVTANTDGSCTRNVYFAFNGTPDIASLGDEIKRDFTKVGVITVTIEPTE